MEAQLSGIVCWDKDVDRLLRSYLPTAYHPFADYMQRLPEWDGTDRITPLVHKQLYAQLRAELAAGMPY